MLRNVSRPRNPAVALHASFLRLTSIGEQVGRRPRPEGVVGSVLPYAGCMSRAEAAREIELKLAVQARDLPCLRQRLERLAGGDAVEVDNVYYDTADGLLRGHRMALRLRRIGRRWVQTLKNETRLGALSARGEWEVPAPRGRLELLRFPPTPLAELLAAQPQAVLQPAFRTRFRRSLWLAADGAIEVALDEGEIVAGKQRLPILELELELKSGAADALYALALQLAGSGREALALRPSTASKAWRGYRLAAGEPPAPKKANARALVGDFDRRLSLAAALRTVVDRGTTLLLANVEEIGDGGEPEFIHQARVAVRRMRSATRLIGADAGWPRSLEDELRWIGRKLGAVRDWDVFQSQTLPELVTALPALTPLAAQAAEKRRRDDAALRAALACSRLARAALRLLRWAATRPGEAPTLADSARKRLGRLRRRLFADASFFVALPLADQHRVRIRAKRLRYALDLCAVALPAEAAARWGEQLAKLQDELGLLNDAAVATELLQQLGGAAAAAEWLAERQRQQALRAELALAALARLPPPWR